MRRVVGSFETLRMIEPFCSPLRMRTYGTASSDVVAKIPQFALLAEVMPYRSIFPTLTVSPEMLPIVNEAVVAAVTGTKDPQTAADEMAAKLAELLKKGGYIP